MLLLSLLLLLYFELVIVVHVQQIGTGIEKDKDSERDGKTE